MPPTVHSAVASDCESMEVAHACVQVVQEEQNALAHGRLLHGVLGRVQHLRGLLLGVRVQHRDLHAVPTVRVHLRARSADM